MKAQLLFQITTIAYGALRLLELLWRCIYPACASVFLWMFFAVTTQGIELLKIFIAGERTVVQHWSLSVGFALTCASIWWVARKILQAPWPNVRGTAIDIVSPRWIFWLPLALSLLPMVMITLSATSIEHTSQTISAAVCLHETEASCVASSDASRPRQVLLFALMTVILFAVIVMAQRALRPSAEPPSDKRILRERGWILFVALSSFGMWFLFNWSGPSVGAIETASFIRHQMLVQRTLGSVSIVLIAVVSWTCIGGIALTLWPKQIFRVSLVALPLAMLAIASPFRASDNDVRALVPLAPQSMPPAQTLSDALRSFQTRALLARQTAQGASKTPPGASTAPIPLYLVAAAGGGLRAAYWSAAVLADLQDQNPQFAQHLFLVSGVSGGGLGAATFIAGLKSGCPSGVIEGDSTGDCVRRVLEDVPLSPVLSAALYGDFWRSIWPSGLHNFAWDHLGFKTLLGERVDRAHVLEHTWETSFAWCSQNPDVVDAAAGSLPFPRAFRCAPRPWVTAMPTAVARANTLSLPMHALWPRTPTTAAAQTSAVPQPWMPHLIINGTDAATGRRILSSGLKLLAREFPDAYIAQADDPSELNLRLSTVVHNGARFPVVSPAGRITNSPTKAVLQPWSPNAAGDNLSTITAGANIPAQSRLLCSQPVVTDINPCRLPGQAVHRIVDGGYFDNSGMVTILDVLKAIDAFNRSTPASETPRLAPKVVVLANSGWSYAVPNGESLGPVSAVLNAYTRTPDARSAQLLADQINQTQHNTQQETFLFNLDRAGTDVPGLGWALSEASTNQMIVASSHPLYHQRVRSTLASLDAVTRDAETGHQIGAATRIKRCIFAIAKTSLAPRSSTLCAAG